MQSGWPGGMTGLAKHSGSDISAGGEEARVGVPGLGQRNWEFPLPDACQCHCSLLFFRNGNNIIYFIASIISGSDSFLL